jgi:ubiquitin-like 1-activating enzyme E1 B
MTSYTQLNDQEKISNSSVLIVGAGGIGCELLKNLVMSGFKIISLVDMDKVEKSNLNRQFLFDRSCIGHYKSRMAAQSIMKTRKDPLLKITSHIGNIKDKEKFDVNFFKQFNLILNALDNIDARTYINIMCQKLKIPLINSGTEGFLGNVANHINNFSPCYNCTPKMKKKSIPICSIRSKPEKIEHCVAWAKQLFCLLFSENTNGNLLEDYRIENDLILNFQNYFFFNILKENSDIETDPVDIQKILTYDVDISSNQVLCSYYNFNSNLSVNDHSSSFSLNDLVSILRLSSLNLEEEVKINGKYKDFDKEQKEIVNFVYSAANLRAHIFKLKKETRFKIKEIAGNIIPAINSTNAIIASIQTIEAVKILSGRFANLRNVNYNMEKKIASLKSSDDERNKNCNVCSQSNKKLLIQLNINCFIFSEFVDLLKKDFKIYQPIIYKNKSLIYEGGDDIDDEEKDDYLSILTQPMSKYLTPLDSELKIRDTSRNYTLNIEFSHNESLSGNQFEVEGAEKFEIEDINIMEVEQSSEFKEGQQDVLDLEDCLIVSESLQVDKDKVKEYSIPFLQHKRKNEIPVEEINKFLNTVDESNENETFKKRRIEI